MAKKGKTSGGVEPKRVSQTEARNRFPALVREAMAGYPVVVESHGVATVAIVSAKDYLAQSALEGQGLGDRLREQFLAEIERLSGPAFEEGIDGALFSGTLAGKLGEEKGC